MSLNKIISIFKSLNFKLCLKKKVFSSKIHHFALLFFTNNIPLSINLLLLGLSIYLLVKREKFQDSLCFLRTTHGRERFLKYLIECEMRVINGVLNHPVDFKSWFKSIYFSFINKQVVISIHLGSSFSLLNNKNDIVQTIKIKI